MPPGIAGTFLTVWPETYAWEVTPDDADEAVQELAPGDHAIVRLTFAPVDPLWVSLVVASDQVVPVGDFNRLGCGGGGATRPRTMRGL